jgi:hypothetical protein
VTLRASRCHWKKELSYQRDWCQKLNKCRPSHNVLIHVDAEVERNLLTARPTKLVEPPDRPRRSPAYDNMQLAGAEGAQVVDE